MAFKIKLKKGTSAPANGALDSAELGYNTSGKITYIGNGVGENPTPFVMAIDTDGTYKRIANLEGAKFDTTVSPAITKGILAWNTSESNLKLGITDTKEISIGEDQIYTVRNATGSTLNKGVAVYASGVEPSGRISVSPYVADGSVREVRFMGIVTENILNGVNGIVQHFGYVTGLDTRGTAETSHSVGDEDWQAGDILYVHPTVAGKLTNVKPQHEITVAIIITRHQSSGKIFVRPTSGGHLEDIHDVAISSPANGHVLIYDNAQGRWENNTITAGSPISITNGAGAITIGLASGYGDTQNPYASKTANTFLAAPNGSNGVPSFRAIVAADIPTLNQNTTGTSAGVVRTVPGTTSAELVRGNMADNDQFRIMVGATASNAGFAEIATADDGTEPIHVRQYTGTFTTLTRTATLLDGSGNTSFPGTVTGTRLISTIATGTAPLSVTSTTAVTNLNADLLDGQHGSYYLDTSASSQTKSGNLTITGNTTAGRYYQAANGIPTGNLGSPTITEMALFDEQFYNQTAFYDISRLKFYSSTNGTTWTEITTITDGQKRTLVGGDNGGGVAIPNLTPYYRIEITNNGNYVYLNALYLYMTTSSHATSVKIKARRRSDLTFVNFATSNNTVNLWPGHVYLPFSTIPYLTGGSSSGHYDIVHIDFQPVWSGDPTYGTQPIFIQKLQIWGGYPAGKRNVFSTDENANVAFPAALTGTRLISNIATGTSPLLVTSTTAVTNLNADLLDGLHSTAFVSARTRTDWNNATSVISNVVGQLAWKNYSNNHTIFDASNSTSPNGGTVSNTNPDFFWATTYPTLMGWNGSNTYGVRVDSARVSDTAATLTTARTLTIGSTGKTFNGGGDVTWSLAEIGAAADNAVVKLTGDQTIAGNKTFSNNVIITGDLLINGATTNINTTNLVVEDKNIIIGDVNTPSDVTASGGGITLKGATDKTITWNNATAGWEFNQNVTTTGRVGIGTSTPSSDSPLHIQSTATGAVRLRMKTTSTTGAPEFIAFNDQDQTITTGIYGSANSAYGLIGAGQAFLYSTSTAINIAVDNAAGAIKFGVGSTIPERMRITAAGDVGIGTTSPNHKLHVVGNIRIEHPTDNVLTFNRTSANTFTFEHDLNKFYLYNATTTVAPLVILNNSNVGIGTVAPGEKLEVVGNIKHTGLVMTTGTNVDQTKSTTFASALTTGWTDVTGVSGTYLATGSYIVQIISNGEYYTGNMSWFSGSTTTTTVDEIELHRAGAAASAARIYARVARVSGGTLKLQVSASASLSSHTMTFTFRRTI